MPMLDLYLPLGALTPDREAWLVNYLTEALIRYEGFDPADPVTQSVSWAFIHRPEVFVGGARLEAPRYKIVASVPEGQLDEDSRAAMVTDVTSAVLDAEDGRWDREPSRVWVFPTDVPEGRWGGRGTVVRLADILTRLTKGDPERSHELALQRLSAARKDAQRLPQAPAS